MLPETAVTCVFTPMLGPLTTIPTVTPAKDGTVFRVTWVEPVGVSVVVLAVMVAVGGLIR